MAVLRKCYNDPMKNFFSFVLLPIIFVFCGCAKVAHMDELLRLDGYSKEKARQGLVVEKQNKNFERLLKAAKCGALKQYPDDKSIWSEFGAPIFDKKVILDGTTYSAWMYRYSTKLFGSDKVYLYFDPQGNFKIYDFFPGGSLTPVNIQVPQKR